MQSSLRQSDQLYSDSFFLIRLIDCKIRKVAAETEIGYRSSNSNEQVAVPSSTEQIRVFQH